MPGQYTDKELTCVDCNASFKFSAGEQEHFAVLGFTNEPKRCGPCRAAKKRSRGVDPGQPTGRSTQKEYHKASCSECGGEAIVPFKPRLDKPVFCSNCFDKRR